MQLTGLYLSYDGMELVSSKTTFQYVDNYFTDGYFLVPSKGLYRIHKNDIIRIKLEDITEIDMMKYTYLIVQEESSLLDFEAGVALLNIAHRNMMLYVTRNN